MRINDWSMVDRLVAEVEVAWFKTAPFMGEGARQNAAHLNALMRVLNHLRSAPRSQEKNSRLTWFGQGNSAQANLRGDPLPMAKMISAHEAREAGNRNFRFCLEIRFGPWRGLT